MFLIRYYFIMQRSVKYVDRNILYWSGMFEQNNDDEDNKKVHL